MPYIIVSPCSKSIYTFSFTAIFLTLVLSACGKNLHVNVPEPARPSLAMIANPDNRGLPPSSSSGDQSLTPTTVVSNDPTTTPTQSLVGLKGKDGVDGSKILMGITSPDSDPDAKHARDGDVYINTDTDDFYQKKPKLGWVKVKNWRGARGETGAKGAKGDQGESGQNAASGTLIRVGTGMNDVAAAPVNSLYLDGLTKKLYYKQADGQLIPIKGADGEPGTPGAAGEGGSLILTGKGAPASSLGKVGNYYIDHDIVHNGRGFYQKETETTWTFIGKLMLDQDAPAPDVHMALNDQQSIVPQKALVNLTELPLPAPEVQDEVLNDVQLGFLSGISSPNDVSTKKLAEIANLLNQYQQSIEDIKIVGSCDQVGSIASNKSLSLRRAKYVQKVLRDHGVKSELTMNCKGIGEPDRSSCSGENCPQDRYVDIDVTLLASVVQPQRNTIINTLNKVFKWIWITK